MLAILTTSGISEGFLGSGLQPVIGFTNYEPEREREVLFEMLSWRPSGVIVAGLEHDDAARRMLERAECPVVEIMDTDGPAIDACVGISHEAKAVVHSAVINNVFNLAQALTNATYRFVEQLADLGLTEAAQRQPALLGGINVMGGHVTHRAVADAHGMPFTAPVLA